MWFGKKRPVYAQCTCTIQRVCDSSCSRTSNLVNCVVKIYHRQCTFMCNTLLGVGTSASLGDWDSELGVIDISLVRFVTPCDRSEGWTYIIYGCTYPTTRPEIKVEHGQLRCAERDICVAVNRGEHDDLEAIGPVTLRPLTEQAVRIPSAAPGLRITAARLYRHDIAVVFLWQTPTHSLLLFNERQNYMPRLSSLLRKSQQWPQLHAS